MIDSIHVVLTVFAVFSVLYFGTYNLSILAMVATAAARLRMNGRWSNERVLGESFANPLMPTISILVPAHNESLAIVSSVRALLGLRYGTFEVIVVDDGSTDDTLALLQDEFQMVRSSRRPSRYVPVRGDLEAVWESPTVPLVVLSKVSIGRRADALNMAFRYARHDLVCMIDADSLLEPDALLRVAQPFVDDPTTIASGGVVRPANGTLVERGRVVDVRAPRRWIERIQTLEYLRSFLFARTAWSEAGALLIISGAFGLFSADALERVGALDSMSLGEDAELVATLHERFRRDGIPYRVCFVPDPVCWTEVPSDLKVLGRQRRRWSHGLGQILSGHRRMIANPRYGALGMTALPFYLLFEALSAPVELLGILLLPAATFTGMLDPQIAVAGLIASAGLGTLNSMAALLVEEVTFRRHSRSIDLFRLVVAAVLENLGYRQILALWRVQGLVSFLRGKQPGWGEMTRAGFAEVPAAGAR